LFLLAFASELGGSEGGVNVLGGSERGVDAVERYAEEPDRALE
jgi:hypothetical protein